MICKRYVKDDENTCILKISDSALTDKSRNVEI